MRGGGGGGGGEERLAYLAYKGTCCWTGCGVLASLS